MPDYFFFVTTRFGQFASQGIDTTQPIAETRAAEYVAKAGGGAVGVVTQGHDGPEVARFTAVKRGRKIVVERVSA
jgi:hypothetical protein